MIFRSLPAAKACLLFCLLLFIFCKSSPSEEGNTKNIEEAALVNVPEMTPRFPGCEEFTNPKNGKRVPTKNYWNTFIKKFIILNMPLRITFRADV
jgi:hypothetical protein